MSGKSNSITHPPQDNVIKDELHSLHYNGTCSANLLKYILCCLNYHKSGSYSTPPSKQKNILFEGLWFAKHFSKGKLNWGSLVKQLKRIEYQTCHFSLSSTISHHSPSFYLPEGRWEWSKNKKEMTLSNSQSLKLRIKVTFQSTLPFSWTTTSLILAS